MFDVSSRTAGAGCDEYALFSRTNVRLTAAWFYKYEKLKYSGRFKSCAHRKNLTYPHSLPLFLVFCVCVSPVTHDEYATRTERVSRATIKGQVEGQEGEIKLLII